MSTKIPYVIFTFISMWSYNKNVLIYYYNGLDAHDCKWCTTICYSSWSSLGSSHFDHILCHTVLLKWGKVWKWVRTRLGWQLLKLSGHTYNLVASILVNNEQSLIESPLLWNQLLDSMYLWFPTRPSWPRTCSFWQFLGVETTKQWLIIYLYLVHLSANAFMLSQIG